MTGVEAFELGQFPGFFFDLVGEFQQQTATIHRRHLAPFRKRRFRRRDGAIDIFFSGQRDIGYLGIVVGIQIFDGRPIGSIDEITVDEEFSLDCEVGHITFAAKGCTVIARCASDEAISISTATTRLLRVRSQ